jgi:hypothetical protein
MIDQGHLEEADDRTITPFAAVAEEYRRHATKVAQRPVTENLAKAAFYYKQTALMLETL